MSCFTQSLEDAGKCSVQIQKRADEAHGCNKVACQRAVKNGGTCPTAEAYEDNHTAETHKSAVFYGFDGGVSNSILFSQRIICRNERKQDDDCVRAAVYPGEHIGSTLVE